MQIKISDLELLLKDYRKKSGIIKSKLLKSNSRIKNLKLYVRWLKKNHAYQDTILPPNELFLLCKWLLKLPMTVESNTNALLKQMVNWFGQDFFELIKKLQQHSLLEINGFNQLVKHQQEIPLLLKIISLFEGDSLDFKTIYPAIIHQVDAWQSIEDALTKLRFSHLGDETENAALILKHPMHAEIISKMLIGIQSANIFPIDNEFRRHMSESAPFLEGICDVIAELGSGKFQKWVGVQKIFHYAPQARVIAEFLKQLGKKKNFSWIASIFPEENETKTPIFFAIQSLSRCDAFTKEDVSLCINHTSNADIYADAIIALHKRNIYSKVALDKMEEELNIAKIIVLFEQCQLLENQIVNALLNPAASPILTLPLEDLVIKEKLVEGLAEIQHPLCYFLLGKIACGEMWGIDLFYDIEKSLMYFKSIPKEFPWHAEVMASLYHISLTQSHPTNGAEIKNRMKFVKELSLFNHPLAQVVKRSYQSYQRDYQLRWRLSVSPLFLFKQPSSEGLLKKLHDDWLIENRDEPELRRVFDERYGLVLKG